MPEISKTDQPNPSEQQLFFLSTLLQLERQIRHADTPAELGFIMVNETLRLVNYKQAFLWRMGATGRIFIEAVSGVDRPDRNAPLIIYIREIIRYISRSPENRMIHPIAEGSLPEKHRLGWEEWLAGAGLWCPLVSPHEEMIGGLLISREAPWSESETALLERLADAYAHAWWALGRRKKPLQTRLKAGLRKGWVKLAVLALAAILLTLPVRLSVLAPVEIVPFDPLIVSAPMEGVIRSIHVEPNQEIKAGKPLFNLDDTSIRNEYEVSKKTLAVARAEYMRATQKAFLDEKSKADLLLLRARIKQKTAEVNYMADVLERSRVEAERNGIVVFGDVNDWLGKPVLVGEKVMTIANPAQVEAEIHLPVEDAINLEPGAETLIFLNVSPDKPLPAKLRQASYEAQVTPEGTLAFLLKSDLTQGNPQPRIGLRGTAKIYGERVSLFYYLMRRPFAAVRQMLGL